ncbi:MAG: helix-turn-helix transcriptional regulator [Actinomycetota bacterium]|nr:helix-turn-helix transcriptional regulator [Actinomycetota bacterium]
MRATGWGAILVLVTPKRSMRPFVEEVPELLAERGMSLRALARVAGVGHGHLSRVLRQDAYKTPSAELTARVAEALGLPADYFPEFREGFVVQRLREDEALRERLYRRLAKG